MPTLTIDVNYPVVDIPKAKKVIGKTMTDFIFRVLGEWVNEVTTVIPVWSGASRATFLKLANQAKVDVEIESLIVAPIGSRIPLGFAESIGVVIADARGDSALYGWRWDSTLDYIGIVQNRVRFIEAGQRVIDRTPVPELPQPPFKNAKDGKAKNNK